MSVVPELTSARLLLRGFVPEDLDASVRRWNDPRVYRHISGEPSDQETCWQRLLRGSGSWLLRGYGYWALCERQSGRCVGEVGVADFGRELSPPQPCHPEAGWVLDPQIHGRGYGTEAMQMVLDWLDSNVAASHSYCIIHPDNEASMRLAGKLGYTLQGTFTYRGEATTHWARPRGGS